MSDLLELIDTIQAEEADVRRLFGGEGTRVRRDSRNPDYLADLAEAASLVNDVLDGRRPMHYLQEAMTTSDFPLLFGDILDRQLLGAYRSWEPVWQAFARRSTVRDFRPAKRFALDGAEGQLDLVPEDSPYPAGKVSPTSDQLTVKKYGRRLPFSWETFVNDDLDALRDAPQRLGRGAQRTVQRFVTSLYVGTSGPNSSLYSGAFGNVVSGNPVLSIEALQTAMTTLASQTDEDGEPIFFDSVTLVVPPALEVTALNIVNGLQIDINNAGGTTNQRIRAQNWMRNRVQVAVDPYIPLIATSNGNTSWFLFGNPTDGRPALEVGFLRGHEEPALFMKRPDAQRIGGTAGPDGDIADFDTDSIQYKVRHVFGGARLTQTGGEKSTVASNGSGS